ncbi:DNA-3-methyladenine glycosylase family protein [Amphibacillus sediminis]|uniref:DNA-3-methyladenine glycosylase family protein n=1 Tax=Amphibacillus sediminis TaxID=360185 RepID=UPI0008359EBD|nr:hypothetical protein [Amphibacillus sediminis]
MSLTIALPHSFNFYATVTDHGWYRLSPFDFDHDKKVLSRVEELSTGKIVFVSIQHRLNSLIVDLEYIDDVLSPVEEQEIEEKIKWIFRLDEDFDRFYQLCQDIGERNGIIKQYRGRLLRSPSLFEDIVKTIFTTNTTWSRTIAMTNNFVTHLGKPYHLEKKLFSFPNVTTVVAKGEDYLKKHLKLGYRSTYIFELAQRIVSQDLDLEGLKHDVISTDQVIAQLKTIKGVGPYAISTILMLLGRYDYLPIDSDFKKHVRMKYFSGVSPSQQEMKQLYDQWGEFKYLAYWFDHD